MRLGQLARQFDITPQEIVNYLKSKGIEANPHPNSKLEESAEAMVIEHFDILPVVEVISDEPIEDIDITPTTEGATEKNEGQEESPEVLMEEVQAEEGETVDEAIPDTTSDEPPVEVAPTEKEIKVATVDQLLADESEELASNIDLIKAPKVELQGLKVVGKIELPQPKAKEEEPTENNESSEKPERERSKGKFKNRSPLSAEEREKRRDEARKKRLEKEKWEAHKQKLREERSKKKAKEEFYKKKITASEAVVETPIKKKKKSKKRSSQPTQPALPKPKTLIGKFWRWLNT